MSHIFEIVEKDAAGRIGKLRTPHGVVETPTVMPVINPNIQTIKPSEMKSFGAEILITNSYIIYTRDELRKLLSGHLCRCTGYENILNAVEKTMKRRLGIPVE